MSHIFLSGIVLAIVLAVVNALSMQEFNVLQRIYNSTNGANWTYPDPAAGFGVSWNFDGVHDPCAEQWHGIQCTCDSTAIFPIIYTEYSHPVYYYDNNETLPFTNYCSIARLSLSYMNMRGPFPHVITTLANLTHLHLAYNFLSGTLPSTLFHMELLKKVEVSHNNIGGNIPSISSSSLVALDIGSNPFVGEFPSQLFAPELVALNIGNTTVSGAIPTQIGQLSKLAILGFYQSSISGNLPTEIGYLTDMTYLAGFANKVVGPLPSEIGLLTGLKVLSLRFNEFTGPIPDSWSSLTQLSFLSLNSNHLTGPVHSFLGTFTELEYLYIDNNQLTGTIPNSFSQLTNLYQLTANSNYLKGTLPSVFGNNWQVFDISNNAFSGELPLSLVDSSELYLFNISDNFFHGDISYIFNATNQVGLQFVDISNNQFGGSLPSVLFELQQVQVIAASINCFNGPLSDKVCGLKNITTLALDALGGAEQCLKKIFPLFPASSVVDAITGEIPPCIFNLPQLRTLHLSTNVLNAKLPTDIVLSSSLVDLDLSHNAFRGIIPPAICAHSWNSLNLAFNRFQGDLCPSIDIQKNLALSNNRLSGSIPKSYLNIHNISLLSSNIFACDVSNHDSSLPSNDPDFNTYECGSEAADKSFYVYVALFCAALVVLYFFGVKHALFDKLDIFHTPGYKQLLNLKQIRLEKESSLFAELMIAYRRFFATLLGFFLLGMCITAALTTTQSTHKHVYAWTFSFCYLTGSTAAAIMFVFIIAFSLALYYHIQFLLDSRMRPLLEKYKEPSDHRDNESINLNHAFFMFVIFSVNLVATLTVNVMYVIYISKVTRTQLNILQIGLAAFKVLWTNIAIDNMLKYAQPFYKKNETPRADALFRTILVMVTNFISPCVGTAIGSKACFYNVVFEPDHVTTEYTYPLCAAHLDSNNLCSQYIYPFGTTKFVPSYFYSYQCASAVLTSYASVYMYMSIFIAFVLPVLRVVVRMSQRFMNQRIAVISEHHPEHRSELNLNLVEALQYSARNLLFASSAQIIDVPEPEKFEEVLSKAYNSNKLASNMISMLSIVVTFGLAFPPLGIASLAAMISMSYIHLIELGNVAHKMPEANRLLFVQAIDNNFRNYSSQLKSSTYILIPLTCTFLSFFIFDAYGDEVGYKIALWVPFASAGPLPLLILVLGRVLKTHLFPVIARMSIPRLSDIEKYGHYLNNRSKEEHFQMANPSSQRFSTPIPGVHGKFHDGNEESKSSPHFEQMQTDSIRLSSNYHHQQLATTSSVSIELKTPQAKNNNNGNKDDVSMSEESAELSMSM